MEKVGYSSDIYLLFLRIYIYRSGNMTMLIFVFDITLRPLKGAFESVSDNVRRRTRDQDI